MPTTIYPEAYDMDYEEMLDLAVEAFADEYSEECSYAESMADFWDLD